MFEETGVQFQVESYQRLKKWYLVLPSLTVIIIRYGSRVKWPIQGMEKHPLLDLGVVAIEKGAFRSTSTKVANNLLLYAIFFTLALIAIFWLLVPISYSFLYLVYATGHYSPTYLMLLWDIWFFSDLSNLSFSLHNTRLNGFLFLSIVNSSTSPLTTAFRCSSSLNFSWGYVSLLYNSQMLYIWRWGQ